MILQKNIQNRERTIKLQSIYYTKGQKTSGLECTLLLTGVLKKFCMGLFKDQGKTIIFEKTT